jgi:hypothetical protein
MPSTDGRSGFPGMLPNADAGAPPVGEFGTVWGRQAPEYRSSSSPAGHDAEGAPRALTGTANAATVGAAATASANPPARMIRLAENSRGAMVTLSVVLPSLLTARRVNCMKAAGNLHEFRRFAERMRRVCLVRRAGDRRAGTDGRLGRHVLRCVLSQPDARPGIVAGARDAVDFGDVGVRRGGGER